MSNSNNEKNLFESPVSTSALNAVQKSIEKSNRQIAKYQDSLDPDDMQIQNVSSKTSKALNKNLNRLFASMMQIHSGEISNNDADNMIMLASRNSKVDSPNKKKLNKARKDIDAIRESIIKRNEQDVNNLVSLYKRKFLNSLTTYNTIIKLIPKMRLVLNTFANTIISPDDFTKRSIHVDFNKNGMSPEQQIEVQEKLDKIIEKYSVNTKIKEDVLSYLINGKLFYLVLSMNNEIKKYLSEDIGSSIDDSTNPYKRIDIKDPVAESIKTNIITEDYKNSANIHEKMLLEEFSNAFNIDTKHSEYNQIIKEGLEKVDEIIKNEFVVSDSLSLVKSQYEILEEGIMNNIDSFFARNIANASEVSSGLTEKEKKSIDSSPDSAIVKRISPANIIPLEFDDNILGYIYLDVVEIDDDDSILPKDTESETDTSNLLGPSNTAAANGNMLQNMIITRRDISVDGNNNTARNKSGVEDGTGKPLSPIEDTRLKFIADTFVNRLSKTTNIKLLRKNETLKYAIYNGLALKKINCNQKLRVVYLKPSEVVYIDRKQSIFDNVLFFANLYIATLITILMQNVMTKTEQRVVYVETGMDNDAAGSIQEVVRNIKSKEIAQAHNMDLQTILNVAGSDNTYYIPVVDGEKPISFDTITNSTNKNLDDEFLSWLSNNIFSGMGMPSAYLTEVENIDFAKSLSMQNSRFLREIIVEQSILGPGLSELIRKIYNIENMASRNKNNKNDSSAIVELSSINVSLPSPSALMLTNLNEQLSNATTVIDSIINEYAEANPKLSSEEVETVKTYIKYKMMKKYVTSFDWTDFEELVEETITDFISNKTEKTVNDAANGNTDSSTMDSGTSDDASSETSDGSISTDDSGLDDLPSI